MLLGLWILGKKKIHKVAGELFTHAMQHILICTETKTLLQACTTYLTNTYGPVINRISGELIFIKCYSYGLKHDPIEL